MGTTASTIAAPAINPNLLPETWPDAFEHSIITFTIVFAAVAVIWILKKY